MGDKVTFKAVIAHEFKGSFADTPLLTAAEMLALSGLLYEQPTNVDVASDILRDVCFDRLRKAGCSDETMEALLDEVGLFLLEI